LQHVDGVMLGREAYHNPYWMASWDQEFYGDTSSQAPSREEVEAQMCDYMARRKEKFDTAWHSVARHMLGLRHGQAGSRGWRQVWSDHRLRDEPAQAVSALAQEKLFNRLAA
jgi:tRNA-dihydrouridine synthase A